MTTFKRDRWAPYQAISMLLSQIRLLTVKTTAEKYGVRRPQNDVISNGQHIPAVRRRSSIRRPIVEKKQSSFVDTRLAPVAIRSDEEMFTALCSTELHVHSDSFHKAAWSNSDR